MFEFYIDKQMYVRYNSYKHMFVVYFSLKIYLDSKIIHLNMNVKVRNKNIS